MSKVPQEKSPKLTETRLEDVSIPVQTSAIALGRIVTQEELRAERAAEEAAYQSRDIVERLRDQVRGNRGANTAREVANAKDAADEIEWLRASKPDAVTRGELRQMAEKLREAHALIGAMLERIGGEGRE
jgi:hypothetical protein